MRCLGKVWRIAYHDIQIDHGDGRATSRGDITIRVLPSKVSRKQTGDQHASRHKDSSTSHQIAPTESLGQDPDEKGTGNDFHGSEKSREQEVGVSTPTDGFLEVLGCEHGQGTATGGVLEDKKRRADEEAQTVGGL